jgi:hypothetical protein
MKPLSLLDIKQALWDERFRNLFPEHAKEITEFLHNPGCVCNVDLYRKLMSHKDKLKEYFPTKDIVQEEEQKSKWSVINCKIDELESKLKSFSKGRKYLSIARWEDQVTVVINELNGFNLNKWKVINCDVQELENKLIHLGKVQVAIARWEDQVTIVVNELDIH